MQYDTLSDPNYTQPNNTCNSQRATCKSAKSQSSHSEPAISTRTPAGTYLYRGNEFCTYLNVIHTVVERVNVIIETGGRGASILRATSGANLCPAYGYYTYLTVPRWGRGGSPRATAARADAGPQRLGENGTPSRALRQTPPKPLLRSHMNANFWRRPARGRAAPPRP